MGGHGDNRRKSPSVDRSVRRLAACVALSTRSPLGRVAILRLASDASEGFVHRRHRSDLRQAGVSAEVGFRPRGGAEGVSSLLEPALADLSVAGVRKDSLVAPMTGGRVPYRSQAIQSRRSQ